MLLPLFLLVLTAVLAVVLYKQAYERPPNFPPDLRNLLEDPAWCVCVAGPPRLPVWGSYWLLLLQDACWLYRSAWAMADRYASKVIGFYLGAFPTVVVHGPELTREMFNRAEFAGRPDTVLTRVRAFGKRRGLFFTDGAFWAEQRRFALRHLRDFGFGRRMACAEDTLRDEVEELLALVRGECDDQVSPHPPSPDNHHRLRISATITKSPP
ncbi:Putative cytochrome P450 304a1 [Gryllus bimaculatus]|nr:Putative cytochrome P450 304a1 [Gryllus bimaculatus]